MFDQVAQAIGQGWLTAIAIMAEMVGMVCLSLLIWLDEERTKEEIERRNRKLADDRLNIAINPPMTYRQINEFNRSGWRD